MSGEWIEAATLDDAKSEAAKLCKPGFSKVEVWSGPTRLAEVDCASPDSERRA